MRQFLYHSFAALNADRLLWAFQPKQLRILCYHGICADDLFGKPWIPGYFVTASAFERQLQYLKQNATVLPLGESIARLRNSTLPSRCVSITFDDGYANNLTLGYPLLRKYNIAATIFVSSAYIESGELYPFLKLQLIRLTQKAQVAAPVYKSEPLDNVVRWTTQRWSGVERELSRDHFQTLWPMTIRQVQAADASLIEFGAHTHTHCILNNESGPRRAEEIRGSIRKVEQWTGRQVRFFAYPNGELGDFGESDKQVLRDVGIQAAVTGIAGTNAARAEMMELKRYPIGLYHSDASFRAEVSGFRTAVMTTRRVFGS